ncbi:hypothetical protein MNEG_6306 [Monoraphidium neglectum]|uniref:Uncharacterized protein n=1 Tax=Monoraphidium neglectum TaxID=145388 RepID=A0A0D2JRR0_9CHLO|nr:hypothetical protein MNEG_6306 [Monoraphidium neglectum]KIZ01658.1 hypothetical protein MNEG_6306 [Monoraphidium neglectum]|eukprot:XP_013900677.1 hypothetical protein MNEG_6306 [Monoraphidium neglectum]
MALSRSPGPESMGMPQEYQMQYMQLAAELEVLMTQNAALSAALGDSTAPPQRGVLSSRQQLKQPPPKSHNERLEHRVASMERLRDELLEAKRAAEAATADATWRLQSNRGAVVAVVQRMQEEMARGGQQRWLQQWRQQQNQPAGQLPQALGAHPAAEQGREWQRWQQQMMMHGPAAVAQPPRLCAGP